MNHDLNVLSSPGIDRSLRLDEIEHTRANERALGRTTGSGVITTLLLPAYNEAEALPSVLQAVFAVIDDNYEVILVDDASTDATAEVAQHYPRCRLLRHDVNRGKGAAVRTGLWAAEGRYIIIMDADNTYPASALAKMVELLENFDFVRGVREDRTSHMPLVNRIGNLVFDTMLRVVHGLEGEDHLTGLYGLRREALRSINVTANRFDIEVEIGVKARAHRLQTTSFPITYGERLGEKKLNAWRDGWCILQRTLSLALTHNPGRVFVAPGIFIWLCSAILIMFLSHGPLITSFAILSLNSFIVAALGATAGFQLVVFGIVAAFYGMNLGIPPRGWLVALGSRSMRRGAGILGVTSIVVGLTIGIVLTVQWLASTNGVFTESRLLIAAGALLSWGMQLVLASLFVSIFSGRLESIVAADAPTFNIPPQAVDFAQSPLVVPHQPN